MVKWPTLQDRLKHPIKTEEEALRQLKDSGITLSKYAEDKLKKYESKRLHQRTTKT